MGKVTNAKDLLKQYKAGERNFLNANLSGANLSRAYLSRADLSGADLSRADLSGADLSGANLSRADFRGTDLNEVNLRGADLIYADLRGAHLSHVDLWAADLRNANLSGVNIRGSLGRADLAAANLRDANLRDTNLFGADFLGADLRNADLSDNRLARVNLSRTNLIGANFENARVEDATLCDCHLDTIFKAKISTNSFKPNIDYRSILRSRHAPGLPEFLRCCGWPDNFVEYNIECAQALSERGVFNLLQSTFISFGEPDKVFAERLCVALGAAGSRTFFFPRDARPGEALMEVMYRGVHENDRVLLVCSEESLTRPAVLHETQLALDRERKLGERMLIIPIALDDYLLERWEPSREHEQVADALRNRVIADFRGALDDEARFRKQVTRLVAALKKDEARDVPKNAV